MYTIKHVAQQVGIGTATLRAWERRYGVVSPQRSGSGYRVYDERDVSVLRSMKQLVDQGWSTGLAAAHTLRETSQRVGADPGGVAAPAEGQAHPSDLGAGLIQAAATLETSELAAVLDQLFALNSFEIVMSDHLFPALTELGDAWAAGRISTAGEHLASHAVMRRLAICYEAAASGGYGPRIALGMAPGVRHEIGLLAFAVAARRRGMKTDYLGADLPIDDWLRLVGQYDLAAVVLALPTLADIDATGAVVTALRERLPDLIVAVGGAEQRHAPEGALRLGHNIVVGVETLASEIHFDFLRRDPGEQVDI